MESTKKTPQEEIDAYWNEELSGYWEGRKSIHSEHETPKKEPKKKNE